MRGVLASLCAIVAVLVVGSVAESTARTSAAWQDEVSGSFAVTAGPNWVSTTCTPSTSVAAGANRTLATNTRAVTVSGLNISICVDTDSISTINAATNGNTVTLTMRTGTTTGRRVGALTVSGLSAGTWAVTVGTTVQRRIVQPAASASTSLPPLHTGWVATSTSGTYTLKLSTASALSGIRSPWAKYDFASGSTSDLSGNNNALTLQGPPNGKAFIGTQDGSYLDVNGQNGGYASFASGIVQNATTMSFSADVRISKAQYWQRIFDVGMDATTNMFLTTQGSNGNLQFSITLNGNPGESRIMTNYAFVVGQWVNVKLTLQPNLDATTTGVLYVNGQEVGRNSALLVAPSDLGATTNNYIGESQYAGDPNLQGWIDNIVISGSVS